MDICSIEWLNDYTLELCLRSSQAAEACFNMIHHDIEDLINCIERTESSTKPFKYVVTVTSKEPKDQKVYDACKDIFNSMKTLRDPMEHSCIDAFDRDFPNSIEVKTDNIECVKRLSEWLINELNGHYVGGYSVIYFQSTGLYEIAVTTTQEYDHYVYNHLKSILLEVEPV